MKKSEVKDSLCRHIRLSSCFCAALLVLSAVCSFAQAREKKEFNDISMVSLSFIAEDGRRDNYIIGRNSQAYTDRRFVEPFMMNAYETTYNLWYIVRIYAVQSGYIFGNPGQEGSFGKRGAAPTAAGARHPVTMISWYDAVVWCNALSEMAGKTPCYTYKGNVLRDSTDSASLDKCSCDWNTDGYRLPSETEWEYAARFRSRTEQPNYQSGALASGQSEDNIDENDVAWSDANAKSTHTVGTTGTPFDDDSEPAPGSGKANAAGLFDMSGNVLEFCWDWFAEYTASKGNPRATGPEFGKERVCRGGSWSPYTGFIYAGDRYAYDPNEAYNFMGFRFCASK